MKCPKCGSEKVHEMRFQNRQSQMACDECHTHGTYYEFGLQYLRNAGLATEYDNAAYAIEQNLMDGDDTLLAVTVHQVGEQSACNFWVRTYGQWLKILPERVMDAPASPLMLHGEVIRFIQSGNSAHFMQDMRWAMALATIQQDAIAMSNQ